MANHNKDTAHKGNPREDVVQDQALHEHERVDAMMPWINRGDLEGEDRDLVSETLAQSPAFQAKLAQEGDLVAALDEIAGDEIAESAAEADAAWAKFKTRLPEVSSPVPEDAPPQAHTLPKSRASSPVRTSGWRRFRLPQTRVGWLATAQTAVLAALAFVLIPGQIEPQPEEYRLLSSDDPAAQAPAGNVVVMLDPETDLATVQAILTDAKARIVDGPMSNGGYVLLIDADDLKTSLAILQASEAVVLAEPLGVEPLQ